MAQLLVRKLEDEIVGKLKERARRNNRSTEEEVRQILRAAALKSQPDADSMPFGTRLASYGHKLKTGLPVVEWRGKRVVPLRFKP